MDRHVDTTIGGKTMMVAAAFAAALSTLLYGLVQGLIPLLAARFLWGLAYGVLNVLSTVYALDDEKLTGRHVGLSRAISASGPAFALSGGALIAVTWVHAMSFSCWEYSGSSLFRRRWHYQHCVTFHRRKRRRLRPDGCRHR